ncbi:hypothetical protein M404DRAFT_997219 [Pisolithus tinctorius Marx 270]|uniref:Uncharacterized protein n=1 Tax=Pisolithus tinctorius Marx 270 TaxID=870435 RepID=A0A0C3P5C3_PISTI|nr:hypothetical protein M404DRAFT_997219 [Pisolithus tinctorius Marx 270]
MSRSDSPCEPSSKPESEENVVTQARESSICPQELSEAQLRRLYDEEEAERLMHLISAYVTEVRLPDTPDRESSNHCSSNPVPPPLPPRPSNPGNRPISEYIANDLILPYLPLDRSTPPPFTTRRFRLASQRLYLTIIPTYQPLLSDLASLALWKDKRRSLLYCACFWVLWYHDGLLAAFLCRIVWCLLRRRFLPYPSLAEFQEKRQNATRARRFGDEVQQRLSVSTLGPVEIWRLFRAYRASSHDKTKHLLKGGFRSRPDETTGNPTSVSESDGENTILEGAEDSEEIQSLKRDLLHLLDVVADLHERINNILMWRRPAVTRRYCILLSIAALSVIVLPAQYVTKLMCMLLGIVYWHLVPVVAALSPANRARIPPLFADAPTDVEYAIELIGQRVASGTELTSCSKTRDRVANPSSSGLDLTVTESIDSEQTEEREGLSWKKWGARIAQGKSLLEENKSISSLSRSLFDKLPRQTQPDRHSSQLEQVHTFPAQHTSALGLITLTSTTIYFTSLTAMQAKLVVPYSQLRSVKKTGLMKGLAIAWVPTDQDTEGVVREERFHWVGDRDELFARLLGRDGGRWMRL